MMETNETDKIIIAKPVACRPGFSNLESFSKVLSSAVNAAPQEAPFSETAVAVIRPRTIRFKPTCNRDLVGAEGLGYAAPHPSLKEILDSKVTQNVVYKPMAKLVSKATIALLANLGGHSISPAPAITEAGAPIQPSNQFKQQTNLTSDIHHDFPVQSENNANATLENSKDDNKLLPNIGDRPSYDGHSWRKYGQKQVKGSEYPRSYYKCTHPNCPVKKKVEKTLDGQIAEIVYKGEHNHSKPQPNSSFSNQRDDGVKGDEGRMGNENNVELSGQSNFSVVVAPINDPITAATCNASVSTSNSSLGPIWECEEVSESLEPDGDDFKSKRMKREEQILKESTVGGAGAESEPRIVVQNNTDSEIIGDGFRWRKYGQKVVKGKIYPRSYYRCTSPKCNVRKYVERMSEDPCNFITTYEGRHSHNVPIKSTNTNTSKTRTKNKSRTVGNE